MSPNAPAIFTSMAHSRGSPMHRTQVWRLFGYDIGRADAWLPGRADLVLRTIIATAQHAPSLTSRMTISAASLRFGTLIGDCALSTSALEQWLKIWLSNKGCVLTPKPIPSFWASGDIPNTVDRLAWHCATFE